MAETTSTTTPRRLTDLLDSKFMARLDALDLFSRKILQGKLQALALGDVKHGGTAPDELSGGIPQRPGVHQEENAGPVPAAHLPFPSPRAGNLPELTEALVKKGGARWHHQIREVHPSFHLFPGIAQPAQLGVVHLQHHAVQTDRVVAARGVVVEIERLGGALPHPLLQLHVQLL